jgi:hypothetical protein
MMQATNLHNLHHRSNLRRLHGAGAGSILAQRQVSARFLIILKVAGQNPSQVLLSQHDNVIEIFPVRHGSVKRVASGVDEGANAVQFVHEYLKTV